MYPSLVINIMFCCLQRNILHISYLKPCGSEVKASACNAADLGAVPGSGDPLEKEMATHSSVLAWRIPGIGEPGRLQSMGLLRVGHK